MLPNNNNKGEGCHAGCHQQSTKRQQLGSFLLLSYYYSIISWILTGLDQKHPVHSVERRD